MDFSTLSAQIGAWLGNTSSEFKGGYSGSGENGNDFPLPLDTPVYAVAPGKVVGQGYYGGGGVVSIQQNSSTIWYYQHLDLNNATVGQTVQAGQLIGYSGGQNSGGSHPSTTEFSGYPHIEVGINAPWGGIWGNNQGLPNIDPRPELTALENYYSKTPVATSSVGSPTGDIPLASLTGGVSTCTQPTGINIANPIAWSQYWACLSQNNAASGSVGSIFGQVLQIFQPALTLLGVVQADPGRAVKFVAGIFLLLSGAIIFILPDAAGVATAVLGAPEAAPGVRQALAHPGSVNPTRVASRTIIERQSEKQAAKRGIRNYRTAAYQVQQEDVRRETRRQAKATDPLRRAPVTAPVTGNAIPLPSPKLGATRNPMSAEEITAAQAPKMPPAGNFTTGIPVERSPATGLGTGRPTYRAQAKTLMTKTPIPDATVAQTVDMIQHPRTKAAPLPEAPASKKPTQAGGMGSLRNPVQSTEGTRKRARRATGFLTIEQMRRQLEIGTQKAREP